MTDRRHVVIVGGGFAGLTAARRLARNQGLRVTVIDRTNHHLFQPLLYQVATAAINPSDIAAPIRSILRGRPNVDVVLGDVTAVAPEAHEVRMADGVVVRYDWLLLAPGGRHAYFGHPEWEVLAPGLKTVEDALEIRRRMLLAFERAERAESADERHRHLTFVVVGGGPTGVEVAGAIAEIKNRALTRDFRHIDPRDATVLLLEGGPRILPSYPPELSQKAKAILRELGVDVRTDAMVTAIEPGAVQVVGWRIPTDTVVWAAGNAASPLLQDLGAPLDRMGRVVVQPDCSVPGLPEVLVLGDAALFTHDQRFRQGLPGIAPVAMQQGRHAAAVIEADVAGRPRRPFRYADKGQLAVIGRGKAVADVGPVHSAGFFAWLTWIFVHIAYLIGFANRVLVLVQWALLYFTFRRGARLITREWAPGGRADGQTG
ncbi:MAG TPA: NAD(P)/FAD-dependent oxidoreductase [Gemmatimonadales bacterium]